MKLNEFRRGNGCGGAGWSALRKAAGRYNGAVGLFNGWNCVNVGGNSYDEDDEEVLGGEEPVEVVAMTRWDEEGEDKVSWEERVDVGTGTVVAATGAASAVVVVVVGVVVVVVVVAVVVVVDCLCLEALNWRRVKEPHKGAHWQWQCTPWP